MKTSLLILITLLLLQSCNDNRDIIKLKNNIGTVSIDVNYHFDGYQETVKLSDCSCCDVYWYTFFNSKFDNYPLKDTLNFLNNFDLDSITKYSLKISHPLKSNCLSYLPKLDDTILEDYYRRWLDLNIRGHKDKADNEVQFFDTTTVNINNRDFILISMRYLWLDQIVEKILAHTLVNKQPITIEFERTNFDTSNFIDISRKVLNTIKIKE